MTKIYLKFCFLPLLLLAFATGRTGHSQDRIDTMKKTVLDAVATGNATPEQKEIAKFLMDLSDFVDLTKAWSTGPTTPRKPAEISELKSRYKILTAAERFIPGLKSGQVLTDVFTPKSTPPVENINIGGKLQAVPLANGELYPENSTGREFLENLSSDYKQGKESIESIVDQKMTILHELAKNRVPDVVPDLNIFAEELSNRSLTNNTLRTALKACSMELPLTERKTLIASLETFEFREGKKYYANDLARFLKIGVGAMVLVSGAIFVTEAYNGNKTAWKKVEMASITEEFLKDSKCEAKPLEKKPVDEGTTQKSGHSL